MHHADIISTLSGASNSPCGLHTGLENHFGNRIYWRSCEQYFATTTHPKRPRTALGPSACYRVDCLLYKAPTNNPIRVYEAVSYEGCMLTIAPWFLISVGASRGRTVPKLLDSVAEAGVLGTEAIFFINSEEDQRCPWSPITFCHVLGVYKYKKGFEACV